ncbi:MAG: hypothetical protein L3K14_01775 [Thermoplasmata archaeon]|nr:hypothetical protein [Thermoplasmata archaeon]
MILRAVIAGAIILGLGALLYSIPIAGQSVGTEHATSTAPATFWEPAVTPEAINFSVSWASSTSATVSVYSCGTDTSCSGGRAYAIPSHLIVRGTATIGRLNFSGVAGDGYEVYSSVPQNVDVVYRGPLYGGAAGVVLLVLGGIVFIAGAAVPAGGLRPPSYVRDAILRQPGEMLRWYWAGNWDGAPGGLLLTNARLIQVNRRDLADGFVYASGESIPLKDLVAVEPSVGGSGAGQLFLKTGEGASRTFTLEGRFPARRAARAIQRASRLRGGGSK